MSITGGISFYEKSKCLKKDGASALASSNTNDQDIVLSPNKYYRWVSSGSDDSTTETLTVTLPSSTAFSRLFIIDHNLKDFQVQYGSGPSDFANVVGLDSYSGNLIDVSNFARNTAYFEFDSVTDDTIIITMDTTQTADEEKYIGQVIITNELGTLVGYPKIDNVELDRDIKDEKSISGKYSLEKGYESAQIDLSLRQYPLQADVDLLDSLHDSEDPFLVWLCGGKPDQFRIKQRGFRAQDVYQMQTANRLRNAYEKNVYLLGVNQRYSFVETV